MWVKVRVPSDELEYECECVKEWGEIHPACSDYVEDIEVDVSEVEFDQSDLEKLVDLYFDEIAAIIANDKIYKKKMKKLLKNDLV
jgi:hypothetical protein